MIGKIPGEASLLSCFLNEVIFEDVNFGTSGGKPLAKFGEFCHGQAGIIDHKQEGRGVDPLQQVVDEQCLFSFHDLVLRGLELDVL